jgi:hypothetical protein
VPVRTRLKRRGNGPDAPTIAATALGVDSIMMQSGAGRLALENLTDLRPEEACLKAVTEILGVPHHVYFIEVLEKETGEYSYQVAARDPYHRLRDVQRLNDGKLMTVTVDGYPGDYVLVIFPFAD